MIEHYFVMGVLAIWAATSSAAAWAFRAHARDAWAAFDVVCKRCNALERRLRTSGSSAGAIQ